MRKLALILLFLLFAAVALFAAYNIITTLRDYQEGEEMYESMQSFIVVPTAAPTAAPEPAEQPMASPAAAPEEAPAEVPAATPTPVPAPAPTPDDTVWPIVDFDALLAQSQDVVCWIYSEGTKINYPVAQGPDNDYYIHKLPDGRYNGAGTIFMDYRNHPDFSDRHTILYGHHMNNGSMFASISRYKRQDYYDQHPVMLILTPDGNFKLEIFAGYVAALSDPAWKLNFESDEAFEAWIRESIARSTFSCDVVPTAEDQIVTLSTCSYEFKDARYVLLGVLRK